MDISTEQLMTVKEAADFLRKSERWLREALTRERHEHGSIPHHRLPGKRGGIRFLRAELTAWLQAGCPPVAAMESWLDSRRDLGSR